MGLDIERYSYGYGKLHSIREWILKTVEKRNIDLMCLGGNCGKCFYCLTNIFEPERLSDYPELLCHSDCDGGYKTSCTEKDRDNLLWGDLDKLKLEIIKLKQYKYLLPDSIEQAYLDLEKDIQNASTVLIFR